MNDTYLEYFTAIFGTPELGTVGVDEFRKFIGASEKKTDDELARVLIIAHEMVNRFCGSRKSRVPQSVLNEAVLQVGQALYFREKETSDGRQNQYQTDGEYLSTLPRKDVMYYAYPLLRPFVGWL